MPLNVGEERSKPSSARPRRKVADELLEEMTSWNPRERIGAFRSWLRGSLSLIHLYVLTVLEADGPLAMSRLAEALDVSVASATGIVDRMVQRGLVERQDQEDDRRVVLVKPTATGQDVFRDLAHSRRAHLALVLDQLTDDELTGLLLGFRALRRARAALGEAPATPPESTSR